MDAARPAERSRGMAEHRGAGRGRGAGHGRVHGAGGANGRRGLRAVPREDDEAQQWLEAFGLLALFALAFTWIAVWMGMVSPSAEAARRLRLDQLVVGPGVPLTDAQWARIEPLLPDRKPKRGGRWRDHRQVIDTIAYKFQTGTQWVHLPERYGNWRGVYNRLRIWALDGTWERVFTALVTQADADKDLNWAVSVDSTIVRAHHIAAGARKKGTRLASRTITPSAAPAAD